MRFLTALVFFITSLALATLFFIVEFTSPKTPSGQLITINLVYFFLAFFLSLAGLATLVLYWLGSLRLKIVRRGSVEAIHRPRAIFKRSARQSILFSTVVTTTLVLRVLGFANPLNIILIISAAVLIEVYLFGH